MACFVEDIFVDGRVEEQPINESVIIPKIQTKERLIGCVEVMHSSFVFVALLVGGQTCLPDFYTVVL